MVRTKSSAIVSAILTIVLSPAVFADVIYADGQQHSVSTFINDNLIVAGYTRINEPWKTTVVDIITGGDIGGNVTVGFLGIVNLAGGNIQGNLKCDADGGGIHIASGTVLGSVEVTGVSPLHISSAHIAGNVYYGISNHFFSLADSIVGGDITTASVNFNQAAISNTVVNGVLRSVASPKLTISNSLLKSGIHASGFSLFSLINTGITGDIVADSFAAVRIEGTRFQVNGIDLVFDQYARLSDFGSGHVTGLTAGGQLIDFDFTIRDNAEIFLIIPEPATILLLGLGGFLGKRNRVRAAL